MLVVKLSIYLVAKANPDKRSPIGQWWYVHSLSTTSHLHFSIISSGRAVPAAANSSRWHPRLLSTILRAMFFTSCGNRRCPCCSVRTAEGPCPHDTAKPSSFRLFISGTSYVGSITNPQTFKYMLYFTFPHQQANSLKTTLCKKTIYKKQCNASSPPLHFHRSLQCI